MRVRMHNYTCMHPPIHPYMHAYIHVITAHINMQVCVCLCVCSYSDYIRLGAMCLIGLSGLA